MSVPKRKCPIALIISRSLWVLSEICWKASSHAFWSRLDTKIQWQRTEFEMLFSPPIFFTAVVRCCYLKAASLCLDHVLMWPTGSCVLCFSIVRCQCLLNHPGSTRLGGTRCWPLGQHCCESGGGGGDSKQSGGCGHWPGRADHTWSVTWGPRVISPVTTQWASWAQPAPVTISFQRKCIERKSPGNEANLYNSILGPGQQFSCSLNKEMAPGTVHQSKLWW